MTENDDRLTRDQIDRFWSRVDKTPGLGPEGKCWEWIAAKSVGYGVMRVSQFKRIFLAHRLSCMIAKNLTFSELPRQVIVRHRCHNPACVRPIHLTPGTMKDNTQDMIRAGRAATGERSGQAKMTWDAVRAMREAYVAGAAGPTELGRRYDITPATAWSLLNNKTWVDPAYTPPPPKRKRVTPEALSAVLERRLAGEPYAKIAEELGMPLGTVSVLVHKHKKKGGVV